MNPVRDVGATMPCPVCGIAFVASGRRRHCSTTCRQVAWRRRNAAPVQPLVAKADTVYTCPSCDARLLGEQYCGDCRTFMRRLGPGGLCPCCDEPVAITELLSPEQFKSSPSTETDGRRS
ncbi:MAG: hypothetical protein ACLP1E_07440 [Acidimicrobiales bacterium]